MPRLRPNRAPTWRRSGRRGRLLTLVALAALPTATLSGQERTVASSEIAVSSSSASLSVLFSDDHSLAIRFSDGSVYVDGEEVGSYTRGDALESSWRALLGQAVALDDGPLAEALGAWSPPLDLDADAERLGARIDAAIEDALTPPPSAVAQDPDGESEVTISADLDLALLRSLLGRTERFIALSEALDGMDLSLDHLASDDIRVHLGESITIEEDETLEATLILIDSDLDVQGHLDGSAVLVGGTLTVGDNARIDGEVHLADARVAREGGVVVGGINPIRPEREVVDARALSELRNEIRDELRREIRQAAPEAESRHSGGVFGAFRHVGRGIGGMMGNLMTFAIIAVLAFAVVRFFGDNLEVVAAAARENPTRAGMVGVAGAFLLVPVWVLGIVALCVTLIGIPVLLAWIPLFPVAAVLAVGLGFLAVASNVGDWVARQQLQGFDWVRRSNTLSVVLAGVAALILPFFAANFIQMAGPWLGFVRGTLQFLGSVAILICMSVGFGAVLLTRGGRRREWAFADAALDAEEELWDDEFRTATVTAEDDAQSPGGAASDSATGTETHGEDDRARAAVETEVGNASDTQPEGSGRAPDEAPSDKDDDEDDRGETRG